MYTKQILSVKHRTKEQISMLNKGSIFISMGYFFLNDKN